MSYAAEVLADQPALYYRFEDPADFGFDSSSYAHHATVLDGTPGSLNSTLPRGAIRTPRLTTPYSVGSSVISSPVTGISIEFWFNTTGDGMYGLVGVTNAGPSSDPGSGIYRVYMDAGQLIFEGFLAADRVFRVATPTFNDGLRHHVVATWGQAGPGAMNRQAVLYIDGIARTTEDTPAGINQLRAPTYVPLHIGHMDGQFPFVGTLDEVAIYPYVLSGERVGEHQLLDPSTQPPPPPPPYPVEVLSDNPTAWWRGPDLVETLGLYNPVVTTVGTPTPVPSLTPNQPNTSAARFGPDHDRIEAQNTGGWLDSVDTEGFTVEFWCRPVESSTREQNIVSRHLGFGDFGGNWDVQYYNNGFQFRMPNWNTIHVPAPIDVTYHVVCTYRNQIARTYIDGTLRAELPNRAVGYGNIAITLGNIGSYMGAGFVFNGELGEVSYYRHELPADRVLKHYQAGIAGPSAPITAADLGLHAALPNVEANIDLAAELPSSSLTLNATLPNVAAALVLDVGPVAIPEHDLTLNATLPGIRGRLLFESFLQGSLPRLEGHLFLEVPQPAAPVTMLLHVLDPTLRRSPTSVTISLSGAIPEAYVAFAIGNIPLTSIRADTSGVITGASLPVPALPAGVYLLNARSANTTVARTATAQFILERDPATVEAFVPDADPIEVTAAIDVDGARRFVFQDPMPGGLGSWVLPRNPTAATHPLATRTLTPAHTTAVHGKHHIYEAATTAHEWTLTGRLFTEDEHAQLEAFADLNRRIYLIDDLGRAWAVALTKVEVTPRLRTRFHLPGEADQVSDWVADYTVSAIAYQNTWLVPQ